VAGGIMHAMIYELIVAPSHQRIGIGTTILKALIQKCVVSGIRDILLFCAQGKSEFYQKRGFVVRAEDALDMEYNSKTILSTNF
jgi:predicted N-acetyltransferase YhbS